MLQTNEIKLYINMCIKDQNGTLFKIDFVGLTSVIITNMYTYSKENILKRELLNKYTIINQIGEI